MIPIETLAAFFAAAILLAPALGPDNIFVLAFTALKFAGAAYLVYLAWRAFRASAGPVGTDGPDRLPRRSLYLRGIVMNVTNPKVSIFFLALLPQFTDPARGRLTGQFLLLGLTFIVATLLVFGAVAVTAGAIGERIAGSPRARKIIDRAAGTVFVALAVKLAAAQR